MDTVTDIFLIIWITIGVMFLLGLFTLFAHSDEPHELKAITKALGVILGLLQFSWTIYATIYYFNN
jgi:hypothetical protein